MEASGDVGEGEGSERSLQGGRLRSDLGRASPAPPETAPVEDKFILLTPGPPGVLPAHEGKRNNKCTERVG